MHSSFILENITPPVFDEGYEIVPAGYVIFSSLLEYKKMKNLDNLIRSFLKRLPEIKNDDDKVFKCLDKIESLVDIKLVLVMVRKIINFMMQELISGLMTI